MNTRYCDFWPYRVQLVDRFGFRHKAILLGVVGIICRNAIGCGMNLFIKQSHIIQSAIIDFKYFHQLTNVNKLLGEIQGLGGLKTGYTENAGENLVSFYKKNGHQFVIVILKSLDRFNDTKNIITWIEANVGYINPKL